MIIPILLALGAAPPATPAPTELLQGYGFVTQTSSTDTNTYLLPGYGFVTG